MKRKVFKQGPNTLVISLPSKWIKKRNIKRGDEINLIEQQNNLVISLEEKKQFKKIKSNMENLPLDQLANYLSTLYTNGYDEIELTGNISLKEITNSINTVVGLEIIEAEKNRILIKSYLKEDEGDIDKIIRKIFQLTKSFIKDIDQGNYNPEFYIQIIAKTSSHCLRLIRKNEYKNRKHIDQFSFVRSVNRLGTAIYWFCEAIKTNKLPKTNLTKELLLLINILEQAYLKNDYNTSNKAWANLVKYKNKINAKNINKLLKNENPITIVHYYAILRDLSNCFVYLRDITLPIEK